MEAGLPGRSVSPIYLIAHGVDFNQGDADMHYKKSINSFFHHPKLQIPHFTICSYPVTFVLRPRSPIDRYQSSQQSMGLIEIEYTQEY
jgi:hypothetical protein